MAHGSDGWCIALDHVNRRCGIYATAPVGVPEIRHGRRLLPIRTREVREQRPFRYASFEADFRPAWRCCQAAWRLRYRCQRTRRADRRCSARNPIRSTPRIRVDRPDRLGIRALGHGVSRSGSLSTAGSARWSCRLTGAPTPGRYRKGSGSEYCGSRIDCPDPGSASVSTLARRTRACSCLRSFGEMRRHGQAGPAPGCPEINQQGHLATQGLALEIGFGQRDRLGRKQRLAATAADRLLGESRAVASGSSLRSAGREPDWSDRSWRYEFRVVTDAVYGDARRRHKSQASDSGRRKDHACADAGPGSVFVHRADERRVGLELRAASRASGARVAPRTSRGSTPANWRTNGMIAKSAEARGTTEKPALARQTPFELVEECNCPALSRVRDRNRDSAAGTCSDRAPA